MLIGEMPTGGAVYWDPHDPEQALNNFGLHITGDSGAGKTQTLRAIIADVCARGLPVYVFEREKSASFESQVSGSITPSRPSDMSSRPSDAFDGKERKLKL